LELLNTKYGSAAVLKSDGKYPLLVWLHGLQGSKELFLPLLRERDVRSFASLVPDLPGFGDFSQPVNFDYSIAAFANFVEELAIANSNGKVILIGHSLGGMVAIKLLESTRIEVSGLISLEGNLLLQDCTATKEIANLSKEQFEQEYLPNLLTSLATSSEPSASFRAAALKKANPESLFYTSCAVVDECRSGVLLELLSSASCPSLLIVGEKSGYVTRSINGATKTVTVPGASHFLIHDDYSRVAGEICGFIKQFT